MTIFLFFYFFTAASFRHFIAFVLISIVNWCLVIHRSLSPQGGITAIHFSNSAHIVINVFVTFEGKTLNSGFDPVLSLHWKAVIKPFIQEQGRKQHYSST